MPLNVGYLTCDRTAAGDEVYTPYYAVDPLLEFIPKDKTIWCPFDEEWSAFYQTFKRGVQGDTKFACGRSGFLSV